ncbi:MAG: pyruvate, water dikinase regulatory protein [Phycisphaerae bacterium]|jgi:regulator of PEP synthase PpsR (kinase-PPPase family)
MAGANTQTIYLISDGTCRTCDTVVKAVLVQFDRADVRIVRKAHVRRPQKVLELVRKAAEDDAIIFYTLVYDRAREAMHQATREHMVPAVDVLGPVLIALFDLFGNAPRARPGMLYKSNQEYFDRIDAVEYTLNHDDGCRAGELADADVVLVGVSRSAKSTTCFYLAYSGVRAANVPLMADSPPPPELLRLDPRRVIGLIVNPYRLQSVREARLRGWGMDLGDDYASRMQIARELRASHEQMEKHGWQCLDASYKGIEEIAREVMQMLADAGVEIRRGGLPA